MKKLLLFVIILLGSIAVSRGEEDSTIVSKLQSYVRNIQVFNRLIPQEKVYLHFDNTGYVLGERIWFKAYVVQASHHRPTALSEVLYVELLNAKGKILETKKLKIANGQCHGDFYLTTLNVEYFPGFYEVRAYTQSMLNFGEETVFTRVFPVFAEYKPDNNYKEDDLKDGLDISLPDDREKQKPQWKDITVSFYPEGGSLVEGILSQVALKAMDKNGRPIEVKGRIINSQGETTTVFSTKHLGMGAFGYLPDGKGNKALIAYKRKEYKFDLPTALSKGYAMTVNNYLEDVLLLQINRSQEMQPALLGLSILCRGEVVFFRTIDLTSSSSSFQLQISKEQLPSGVNQVVLFDSKGEIFAERLLFIYPSVKEKVEIAVVSDKPEYRPLEKVTIELVARKNYPLPEVNFSLSVRDVEETTGSLPENLASYFLLSSDLQGYIENPSYYFEDSDKIRQSALDLLMLVQGWKRYEWQSMAGVEPFRLDFEPEKQLMIKGRLLTSSGKNAEVKLWMHSEDGQYWMEDSLKTDEEGVFRFYPEDYDGEWMISLRSRQIENAEKNIRIDRWFEPEPKYYSFAEKRWSGIPRTTDREEQSLRAPREIQTADSVRQLMLPEIKVTTKRSKDLIYEVGKEVDRMLDKGRTPPAWVHDYLSENDENYKGTLSFIETSQPADYQIGMDYNNATDVFFDTQTEVQSSADANEYIDAGRRGQHFATGIDSRQSTEYSFSGSDLSAPSYNLYEAQAIKDNIRIRDISRLESNGVFFYKEPFFALFFHLNEGKWDVATQRALRLSARDYDIRVQQYTSRRKIQEVKRIEISQSRKTDDYAHTYVPIYIYPFKNYPLRIVRGTRYTAFQGYSKPKEFFSADEYREDSFPDTFEHKRTLYWNPNITMGKEGKTSISFYNNLTCRKIDVSLEGITPDGILVEQSSNQD